MANVGMLFAIAAGLGCYGGSRSMWRKNYFTVKAANGHDQGHYGHHGHGGDHGHGGEHHGHHGLSDCAAARFGKYGLPRRDMHLRYKDFEVSFDFRNRQPNWVLELLTCEKISAPKPAKCPKPEHRYHQDKRIPATFQPSEQDFSDHYWTGRFAAEENYGHDTKAINDTYSYANVTPQNLVFNVCLWEELENYIRRKANYYQKVYVYSGPIYQSKDKNIHYPLTNCSRIAVPTDFFKIVIGELEGGCLHIGCFIVPNDCIPKHTEIDEFRVDLDEIEKKAGFKLFRDRPFSGPLVQDREMGTCLKSLFEDWKLLTHEDPDMSVMKRTPRKFTQSKTPKRPLEC